MKNYIKNNTNLSIFLVCILVAIIIWLSMSLSRNYVKSYYYPIQFENIPIGKKIINDNILLKTSLEAQGWDLIFKKINKRELIIDLNEYSNEKNIKFTNTKALVQEKLTDLNIKEVSPLFFTLIFQELETKKVPIILNVEKKFKSSFYFSEEPKLSQDSITISSDKETLSSINSIETEGFRITEKDSLKLNIALVIPEEIKTEQNTISVKFKTEEFIEKEFKISVGIDNKPENIDLIIYPEEIVLKCLIPISIYENISASDFYISADFNNIEVRKDNMLLLSVKDAPKRVKNILLEKEKVEFIIYQ